MCSVHIHSICVSKECLILLNRICVVYISSAVHSYVYWPAICFALSVHTRPDTGYHWRMFLRGGCGCVCSSADVRVDGHLGWSESLICICMSYRSVLRPWLVSEQYYREQPRLCESRTSGDTHISIVHRGPHASRVSWSQFSLTIWCIKT
jgi:hypothetical protein